MNTPLNSPPAPYQPGDLLKPAEVALILSISRTQAYRLLGSALPAIRLGRIVRCRRSDLQKYIDGSVDYHE